jgi:hypothetical protein
MVKEVLKFNGKKALRKNCRLIKGKLYEKNVDCFLVDGRWNRVDNGLIFYDNEDNTWKKFSSINHSNLKNGIINDKFEYGYFTVNEFKNILLILENGHIISGISKEILNEDYIDELSSEFYVHKNLIKFNKKGIKHQYKNRTYNIEDNHINILENTYNKLFPNYKNYEVDNFLKGFKFGLEYETSNGYIKKHDLAKHGVQPLLDGSLRVNGLEPLEYTTIPYSGYQGVKTIESFADILDKRCTHSNKCSLHLHISGLKLTKNSLISLYKVITDIQNSIFEMFPAYKKDYTLANLKQNYCKFLPEFGANYDYSSNLSYDSFFRNVFKFFSCGYLPDATFNLNSKIHPIRGKKWNITSRYVWCNLVPFIFQRKETVEFRIHESTFNKQEIISWLYFCISILKYVENNGLAVFKSKVTIENILKEVKPDLLSYYHDRVNFYKQKIEEI